MNYKFVLSKPPVFLGEWKSKFDVVASFEGSAITLPEFEAQVSPYLNEEFWLEEVAKMQGVLPNYKDVNVLFAYYDVDGYEGEAFVLFEEKTRTW